MDLATHAILSNLTKRVQELEAKAGIKPEIALAGMPMAEYMLVKTPIPPSQSIAF